MKGQRYALLDTFRGVAIVNMIVYHAIWDLVYICGLNWTWYHGRIAYIWQQAICWTFILLSGFCQRLGKHRIRRGLVIFGAGMGVSAVSALAVPDNIIWFGILTLIGSGVLLAAAAEKWLERCAPAVGLGICLLFFVFTKMVSYGSFGLLEWAVWQVPNVFYRNLATAFLGFPPPGFFSADYFPLIPWIFLFFAGYFLFELLHKYNCMDWLESGDVRLLSWMGRHSLLIYLLHQPIWYILWILII